MLIKFYIDGYSKDGEAGEWRGNKVVVWGREGGGGYVLVRVRGSEIIVN